MIVVNIEMWPQGSEERKRPLATIVIANVGGTAEYGHYEYAISHQADSKFKKTLDPEKLIERPMANAWRHGTITNFKRHLGAVQLLRRVLAQALGG